MLRRLLLALVLCCTAAGLGAPAPAAQAQPAYIPPGTPLPEVQGQSFLAEVESNNSFGTATYLPSTGLSARGDIYPSGDVDYYSFTGGTGDRVYVALMTSSGASGLSDSLLQVLDIDGVTVLEEDNNDGSLSSTASSVAGVVLPANGLFYVRVSSLGTTLRPYHLHFVRRSGSPSAEIDPNTTPADANVVAAKPWIAGSVSVSSDVDFYQVNMQAGGTIFASLDLNPTRAGPEWNGRLGVAAFGNNVLVVNDSGAADSADSEAIFMTVKEAGTYYVYVDSNNTGTGSYQLSIVAGGNFVEGDECTTYNSTDVPEVITFGPSVVTSTLTIPDQFYIADLNVSIYLTHTSIIDLDVVLVAPGGSASGLFTDIESANHETMDLVLDDEAGIPIGVFAVLQGMAYQPESDYRLHWFDGQQAYGEWSLVVYDDAAIDRGELLSWSITACARPQSAVVCPAGTSLRTVAYSDFEDGADGFTHSGTQDEWELGTPSHVAVNGCFSGSQCWATDLDGTYNASITQTLFSPIYSLAGYQAGAWVFWAQKHQLESASFDRASVDIFDGNLNTRRLWEWRDGTMVTSVGNPSFTLEESAGWAARYANITDFIGEEIGLTFKLQSDSTVQYGGLAIDNVILYACKTYPLYLPQVID